MKRSKAMGVNAEKIRRRKIAQLSKASSILLMLILLLSSLSVPICIAEEETEGKIGVFVIASGSPSEDWCKPVRAAVKNVSLPYPVELGFLDFVPNETITAAVERFDDMGITKILAVPLFISSYSDHIRKIEYVLGLRANPPEGAENLTQVDTNATIELTKAMDDHPLVAYTLADRVVELSKGSGNETVVIMAYGTDNETDFVGWNNSLATNISRWGSWTYFEHGEIYARSLAEQVKAISNFKDVRYGFMGYQGSPNIRQAVEEAAHDGSVIVVTTNSLGSSYVDGLIAKKLKGLKYSYNGKGFYGYPEELSPHPNIVRWIELIVSKQMKKPTQIVACSPYHQLLHSLISWTKKIAGF